MVFESAHNWDMQFPQKLLDEIRARLSVSEVVGRKVALKRAGREYKGLSPFKAEKTPSFTVNDNKGFYHCFASGEHGDIFTFLMKTEGLSFSDAVKRLAGEAGVPLPMGGPSRHQSKPSLRVSDKIALINKVGRVLEARYDYNEIDIFLAEYDIEGPEESTDKCVYSKTALRGVANNVLLEIAQELDVDMPRTIAAAANPPRNWLDTTDLRLFVSHTSRHKEKAMRLKECLVPFAISGFVAHEDIHPTLEWQSEIERALNTMDAFIAILTDGFSTSIWTQQEIGYALGRGVKVISFKMGEDPTGFVSKHQALPRRGRTAEEIATEVEAILAGDPLTSAKLNSAKRARQFVSGADDIPF